MLSETSIALSDEHVAPISDAIDLKNAQVVGLIPPHLRPWLLAAPCLLLLPLFIYDGWFDPDPEMQQHQTYNRSGSFVLISIVSALYLASRSIKAAIGVRQSRLSAQLFVSPDGAAIKVATIPWLWALLTGGLNLLPHGRPSVGILWFICSHLTLGLAAFVLPFFVYRLLRQGYETKGWSFVEGST